MGPVRAQRCPVRLHALRTGYKRIQRPPCAFLAPSGAEYARRADVGSGPLLPRGEGQEQLPLQQECRVGLRVPPSTMLAFRWSGLVERPRCRRAAEKGDEFAPSQTVIACYARPAAPRGGHLR
jgi:hypothetical protein